MKKIIKNQEGMALSFVVMTLLVLFIMASIVASLAQANIKQASTQEQGLQAYYAARSGAEMAFEALWNEKSSKTLLKNLKDKVAFPEQSITFPDDGGSAKVSIKYSKKDADELIEISSRGTYKNATRNVELKVYFEVDSKDTNNSILKEIVWSK